MMRQNLLLALCCAAVLPACGDKAPKKTTTPAAEAPAPAVEKAPEPAADQEVVDKVAAQPAKLGEVVYFAFDSSTLDDSARQQLDENADWMRENPERTIVIEGHTDEQGTGEYNIALGDRRARTVRDYLVRQGIEDSRIRVISYGEERPAGSDDDGNRRSMFVLSK